MPGSASILGMLTLDLLYSLVRPAWCKRIAAIGSKRFGQYLSFNGHVFPLGCFAINKVNGF